MRMITKHIEITKEDILSGEYDSQYIVDPLWWSVSIYDGKEQYEKDLESFNTSQRGIFAILWYSGEVCNGGHDQFLYNSTGIVWEDALKGFEMISADKCAENLRDVIKKCGGSIPFDRGEREEMLDRITTDPDNEDESIDLFEENDSVFYDEEDELENIMMAYIQPHVEDFVFFGDVLVPESIM